MKKHTTRYYGIYTFLKRVIRTRHSVRHRLLLPSFSFRNPMDKKGIHTTCMNSCYYALPESMEPHITVFIVPNSTIKWRVISFVLGQIVLLRAAISMPFRTSPTCCGNPLQGLQVGIQTSAPDAPRGLSSVLLVVTW